MKYTPEQIRQLYAVHRIDKFYNSKYWRHLSHQIIKEFDHDCQLCKQMGKASTAVLVHHVLELRAHPELAYSRTFKDAEGVHIQLLPLCHDCHERIHNRGKYADSGKFVNEEWW